MNAIESVSQALAKAQRSRNLKDSTLAERVGVTRQTVSRALRGTEDFRVSTLLALADQLGLELVLVPKGTGRGLVGDSMVTAPAEPVRSQADQLRNL